MALLNWHDMMAACRLKAWRPAGGGVKLRMIAVRPLGRAWDYIAHRGIVHTAQALQLLTDDICLEA